MGPHLSLFIFYILPRWSFLGLNLPTVSAHFWLAIFFIPRTVDLTQWYPYGVPFESLSFLYPPWLNFFGFQFTVIICSFLTREIFYLGGKGLAHFAEFSELKRNNTAARKYRKEELQARRLLSATCRRMDFFPRLTVSPGIDPLQECTMDSHWNIWQAAWYVLLWYQKF